MKKSILIIALYISIPLSVFAGELPSWVYNSAQKNGDMWLFSGDAFGKQKFNVHVLLEVSDADLQKAKADFSQRGYKPKPVMKPKKDEGIIKSLIRKISL